MIDQQSLEILDKYFPLEVWYYKQSFDSVNVIEQLSKSSNEFTEKAQNLVTEFKNDFLKPITKNDLINIHLMLTIVWDEKNHYNNELDNLSYKDGRITKHSNKRLPLFEINRQHIKLRNRANKIVNPNIEKLRFEPENIDIYLNKKSVFGLFDYLVNEGYFKKEKTYFFIEEFLKESQNIIRTSEAGIKKAIQRRDNLH